MILRHLATLFVISVALLAARDAQACSRRVLPPATRLAMADLVVDARVDLVSKEQVSVVPTAVRKGTVPDRQMQITGVTTTLDAMLRCEGVTTLERGRTYLFLLFDRLPGEASWRTIDLVDGAVDLKDPVADEILRANGRSTPWTRGADGLWLKAVIAKAVFAVKEEIDVLLVFRNSAAVRRELRYRSWPPAERSSCLLEGAGISGVPVPIAQKALMNTSQGSGPLLITKSAPAKRSSGIWTWSRLPRRAGGTRSV